MNNRFDTKNFSRLLIKSRREYLKDVDAYHSDIDFDYDNWVSDILKAEYGRFIKSEDELYSFNDVFNIDDEIPYHEYQTRFSKKAKRDIQQAIDLYLTDNDYESLIFEINHFSIVGLKNFPKCLYCMELLQTVSLSQKLTYRYFFHVDEEDKQITILGFMPQ